MAKGETSKRNVGDVTGFHTPLGKTAQKGDAADASPAMTPMGPPPDPIGNIESYRKKGNTNLPMK